MLNTEPQALESPLALGYARKYHRSFPRQPADCPPQCSREYPGASAAPRRSRLFAPCADAPAHLLVRNAATRIGISEATLHHHVEGQLANNLLRRAVFRLLPNQLSKLFL